jgi:hypothetical protein
VTRPIVVTALATTPVKGLRVSPVDELRLEPDGVPDDRRFFLIDDRRRLVNGKRVGTLGTVIPAYRHADRTLRLTFPDGAAVEGVVRTGDAMTTLVFSRAQQARPVLGPWSEALSAHFGRPLRLVEIVRDVGADRGHAGAVSLMSHASLTGFEDIAGLGAVDGRRFRMHVEIDGVAAHAEDGWLGRRLRVGAALVRISGHIGRCSTTQRHPDTGVLDVPTLDVLRSYRSGLNTTEPLAFGVYGEVLEAGTVALGDAVALA